jgi:hypothetical protein
MRPKRPASAGYENELTTTLADSHFFGFFFGFFFGMGRG